jgi:hypothetical protein
MRTIARARRSPAARAGEPVASRRGRAVGKAEAAPRAPRRPPQPEAAAIAVTTVRMLQVDEGLYALRVGAIAGNLGEIAGMVVPAAQVSAPFAEDGDGVEIVASFPQRGPWLDNEGGTVILRSPIGGGLVIVTVYGGAEHQSSELSLDLQRLDGPEDPVEQPAPAVTRPAPSVEQPRPSVEQPRPSVEQPRPTVARPTGGPAAAVTEARDVSTEILLHIERTGDRLFPGRGWVGALGRRMRIEAFSIRPLERLVPSDIEMKGFLPNGGETPWVPGGVLCGTRGRGLPLTGFAVRVVPQLADRFEVVYQGSFFAGGISQMHQSGAPCRAATADDPLEAINVRLIDRAGEPE